MAASGARTDRATDAPSGRLATGRDPSRRRPAMRGFWDEDVPEDPASRVMPDPALELEAGRAALVAGALDEAALRFGIALRLAPALAPAVLEATAGARVASLLVVRGDAHRVAGHEMEAQEAYLVASHGGLPERRKRSRLRPKIAAKSGADHAAKPRANDADDEMDESDDDAADIAIALPFEDDAGAG